MFNVKETTTLGLSLPLFTGTETECYEWIAAQKLAGDRRDYVVKPDVSHLFSTPTTPTTTTELFSTACAIARAEFGS